MIKSDMRPDFEFPRVRYAAGSERACYTSIWNGKTGMHFAGKDHDKCVFNEAGGRT
jgi:hypothetical protein